MAGLFSDWSSGKGFDVVIGTVLWLMAGVLSVCLLAAILFGLFRLHQAPQFTANSPPLPGRATIPLVPPVSVVNGLAVYAAGAGEPILLMPYPHGHTVLPMIDDALARSLLTLGRRVITFDPPGAYASTRTATGTMAEMLEAAEETLTRLGVTGPVDVVGHSMGGLVALAYSVENPGRVKRLVLSNSVSGFPEAVRCGFPGSAFRIYEPDYWRVIVWGIQLNSGRSNLATHKKLQNLMEWHATVDKEHFQPLLISPADYDEPVPIRMIWSRNMYRRLSYADRLAEVVAPTLVIGSLLDPETGLACSQELARSMPNAELVVFKHSGHAPFVEEEAGFRAVVGGFLSN